MRSWGFAKGHAARNDFVVLNDRHGLLAPSDDDVRYLCDRRAGLGADGLLRGIKANHMGFESHPDMWFMDSRAADGSQADFGGNGLRVFACYLWEANLMPSDSFELATPAGLRRAVREPDGRIATSVGRWEVRGPVRVGLDGQVLDGIEVQVRGGRHVVCRTASLPRLDPTSTPTFEGATGEVSHLELVASGGPGAVVIEIWERGIGTAISSGAAAVATAAALRGDADSLTVQVATPGGLLEVRLAPEETLVVGPAAIVAMGEVRLPDSW